MKRIALVHDFLTFYSGAERVLEVFHSLYPEAPIYTLLADNQVVQEHFPKATIITSPLQHSLFRSRRDLLLAKMPQAIESFNLTDFDVVISSSGAFSHGVITGPHTSHICYCHSPMRYVWDWHAEYLEERGVRTPVAQFVANQVLSKIRIWDAVAAKRVDRWIANSSVVADRIKKYYRADSSIITPPVELEFFDPAKLSKPVEKQGYALTVSRLSKNKRVQEIIEACAKLGMPLRVAGSGNQLETLKASAANLQADVTFLGAISEEEKREQLAGAACFVFAAEDDFGIAPVEALSMGTPVVALGKGGILDSVQDGKNGLLYPDATSQSLQQALEYFREKGVSMNPQEIRVSAERFNRHTFAEAIRKQVDHA